eukprot:1789978-Rhodomonas_salina.1
MQGLDAIDIRPPGPRGQAAAHSPARTSAAGSLAPPRPASTSAHRWSELRVSPRQNFLSFSHLATPRTMEKKEHRPWSRAICTDRTNPQGK